MNRISLYLFVLAIWGCSDPAVKEHTFTQPEVVKKLVGDWVYSGNYRKDRVELSIINESVYQQNIYSGNSIQKTSGNLNVKLHWVEFEKAYTFGSKGWEQQNISFEIYPHPNNKTFLLLYGGDINDPDHWYYINRKSPIANESYIFRYSKGPHFNEHYIPSSNIENELY